MLVLPYQHDSYVHLNNGIAMVMLDCVWNGLHYFQTKPCVSEIQSTALVGYQIAFSQDWLDGERERDPQFDGFCSWRIHGSWALAMKIQLLDKTVSKASWTSAPQRYPKSRGEGAVVVTQLLYSAYLCVLYLWGLLWEVLWVSTLVGHR